MSPLRAKAPRSREKRLDTLGAWLGPVSVAAQEFAAQEVFQRIRTFAQSSQDDLLYALRILSGIKDSVTIIHGPRGCAAVGLYHIAAGSDTRWIVTNLDERDTIMGADRKLRQAVTALHHRYRPKVAFIVGNPTVAINNDDVQSVVEELQEELDLLIVPIYVTGFSSQNAVSGYDTALHAALKYLAGSGPKAAKNDAVNLLSVAEHPLDRKEAQDLLESIGLQLNILPDQASVDSFKAAPAARASVPLCPDAPEYLGSILREKYGVPFIDAPRPVGIEGTGRWLKSIGAALGIASAAEELHNRKAAETARLLRDFSLKGAKVYISLASASAFSLIPFVEEFGGVVAGVTVTHLDRLHVRYLDELAARNPALQIHVADGQEFEEISILRRISPDLYLGDSTHISQVASLGIPTVSVEALGIVGYSGVLRLAGRIRTALANPSFGASLTGVAPPYRDAWYSRSDNWHIKQEVK